jgi:hypothetical protein
MVARHSFFRAQTGLVLASLFAVFGPREAAVAQAPVVARALGAAGMHDAISEPELRKQAGGTAKMEAQMAAKTTPVGDVHPAPGSSFLTSSIFLFDGEMFTVVPIGSILNLPAAQRRHVIDKPEGSFTVWPNFLKRNTSWLTAKEVSLKMAKGDADAGKAVLRDASTDSHVVVSVYKGGPITILEAPAEAATSAKSAAAATDASGSKRSNP